MKILSILLVIILFFGCHNEPYYKYKLGDKVLIKTIIEQSPDQGVVDELFQKHSHNYYKIRTRIKGRAKILTIPEECIIKVYK